ncbi:MAG: hypothetical protein NTU98_14670 [Bacteroidetes bacterium]|nr:hypothetical protein [Bacteroidota bacterium]
MKKITHLNFCLLTALALLLFAFGNEAKATDRLSAKTGNWSDPATWSPSGVPGASDKVFIASGHTVTVNGNYTCASLTFNISNVDTHVNISGTYTLTINGPLYFYQPNFNPVTNLLSINNGTVTVNGLITFAGIGGAGTENRKGRIDILGGTLNANAGITFEGPFFFNKIIDMQEAPGNGTINLKGALTGAEYGTFYGGHSGSVFNYADDVAQTINFFYYGYTAASASHYCNLYINNTSATGVTLSEAVTTRVVAGNIMVQNGKLKNSGFDITGTSGKTFGVSNGAFFEMTGTAVFPTGFSTFAFDPTSTVRYLQTNNQTIYPCTYGHLEIKPSTNSITHTFGAGTTTVAGNLTAGNGTNTGVVVTAATNAATLNILGNFTISANSSFRANATNALSLGGDWTNNGTFTHNSGTVNLNGSSLQTIKGNSSTTFNNLTCDNPTGITLTNTLTTALGNTLIKRGTFTVPAE